MARDYLTLGDALADYYRVRRGGYSPSTWEAHERCLEKWRDWIAGEIQSNPLLETIANPDERYMERYCNKLRPPAYSPSSFNNMRQYLTAFWKYCLAEAWIRTNPMRNVRSLRVPRRARLQLSRHELIQLVEECPDPRDRIALAVGVNTALRGGDVAKLYVGSANLTDDTLTAYVDKTDRALQFAITADLRRELLRWFDHYATSAGITLAELPNDWRLIPKIKSSAANAHHPQGPRIRTYLSYEFLDHPERIVQRALERMGHATKNEGFHTLRRSSGRAVYEHAKSLGNADPLRMAQVLFDHKSRRNTEDYLGITPEKEELAGMMRGKSFLHDADPASVVSLETDRGARKHA